MNPFPHIRSFFVAEFLSQMIAKAVKRKEVKAIKMNIYCPMVSYICFFADDSLIFMEVDRGSADGIKQILEDYCSALGQTLNFQKSCVIIGSNAKSGDKKDDEMDFGN